MYTVIIHPLRKALNLSMNEYAVLDSIMKLSNNTEYSGWCIISRDRLADALDLSKPTIIKIYDTLEIKGLIIKNKIGHARPIQSYIDLFATENEILSSVNIFTNGKETLPPVVKKINHNRLRNFTEIGKETLPYSNNDINNDNNINISWKTDFEVYKDSLRKEVKELINDKEYITQQEKFNPNLNIKLTIEKACINYWATEAGWKHKIKSRSKDLNWKSTITNAISSPLNKVYKGIKNEAFTTNVNSKYPDAETYKRQGYDR
jgi:predicted transcriptional regulator